MDTTQQNQEIDDLFRAFYSERLDLRDRWIDSQQREELEKELLSKSREAIQRLLEIERLKTIVETTEAMDYDPMFGDVVIKNEYGAMGYLAWGHLNAEKLRDLLNTNKDGAE